MKWIKLKLFDYTNVLEEVSHVNLLFRELTGSIERTNSRDEIKEFFELQEQVKQRIIEIKQFIERFNFDSRVSHFMKANKSLIKILKAYKNLKVSNENSKDANTNKRDKDIKLNEENFENPGKKARSQSAINSNKNSKINDNDQTKLNNTANKVTTKNTLVNDSKLQVKPKEKSSSSQEKHYYQNEPSGFIHKSNPKFGDKLELIGEKSEKSLRINNYNKTKFNENNDFSQWREIVFKIRLTSDEYNLLMQEKQNKKNNLSQTNLQINKTTINNDNLNKTNMNITSNQTDNKMKINLSNVKSK